jgi:hypothetical protein
VNQTQGEKAKIWRFSRQSGALPVKIFPFLLRRHQKDFAIPWKFTRKFSHFEKKFSNLSSLLSMREFRDKKLRAVILLKIFHQIFQ